MRHLFGLMMLAVLLSAALPAAAAQSCLKAEEQRRAIQSGQVVPLGTVLESVRRARAGEVVRVRLCDVPSGRAYLVTVLRRDGKVITLTYDARTGAPVTSK